MKKLAIVLLVLLVVGCSVTPAEQSSYRYTITVKGTEYCCNRYRARTIEDNHVQVVRIDLILKDCYTGNHELLDVGSFKVSDVGYPCPDH